MSAGVPCSCPGTQAERRARWVVRHRRCNYSRFNGGRRTHSDYSEVVCTACPSNWRTSAAYVHTLPDERPRMSLGEALPAEMARVRELTRLYRDPELNGAGELAARLMEASLCRADHAVITGDLPAMITAYIDLQSHTG